MHLRRLRDLTDYEVADGNPDVRGWTVRGGDGRPFGEVTELIVEEETLKVRYLDVELSASLNINDRERHILIPIGVAALDDDGDNLFVPSLTLDSVLEYPPYQEFQITREYEEAMLRALRLELPAHSTGPFYEQPSFDEGHFYGTRRAAGLPSGFRRREV
ncbi:PRC-barrel domain-containing protein [Microvirga sp. STR05]|uniref:PRC-barrel domain-containing protein n=1 Tax=Hymenobacter duratus TaxID=2771356 RepID=A0ABR8JB53_9BACT|nr:PRC-barrel domain-containing protein [Hymenobacter duratus]MBD2713884.1 PRC-barrel domain-containing protein [Hymenobacter duratus]MBR7948786.1 PRC-barrel domain-containing protein [Microvirga sp. STR05]